MMEDPIFRCIKNCHLTYFESAMIKYKAEICYNPDDYYTSHNNVRDNSCGGCATSGYD